MESAKAPQAVSPETRLRELGIEPTQGPRPLGAYVEAVQTGNLLFLTGQMPIAGYEPAFVGRLGKELDGEEGREAARVAAINVLLVARQHLGSLDRVRRIVRLSVFLATAPDFSDQPRVADGASELFRDIFGKAGMSVRSVVGVASLPLGVPVELEVTLEVEP